MEKNGVGPQGLVFICREKKCRNAGGGRGMLTNLAMADADYIDQCKN